MGDRPDDPRQRSGLDRRQFLRAGVATTVGLGTLGLQGAGAALSPRSVRSYRELGKTGLRMPDIGMGTSRRFTPDLVRYAFERGITYFDTAESYPLGSFGAGETLLGQALSGIRDKVVIATKGSHRPRDRRDQMMAKLEASLKRLGTDHVDVYLNHAVNHPKRLLNPEWHEFVSRAKEQGKIRAAGISGHGGQLRRVLETALAGNLVDVILVAYNFGQDPAFYEKFTLNFDMVANQNGLPPLLERAHEQGIGVIAMKTLMGARLNDMRPYEAGGATTAQAAFRWVLSNPNVDGLIVTMKDRARIDEYLAGSGRPGVSRSDARLLERYVARNSGSHCRRGCDVCEGSCPAGVRISEVLRSRMYAEDYGDAETARGAYASLGAGAAACATCSGAPCQGSCPFGLDVPGLVRSTPALIGAQPSAFRSARRRRAG